MDTTSPSLAGRTAVVTGSTSGIGAATAHQLAGRGARVVVTGRDAARGREVVDAITHRGRIGRLRARATSPPRPHCCGTWPPPGPRRSTDAIDVLVHNAAICPPVDTVSLTDDDLEATLAVNVRCAAGPHRGDRARDGRARRRRDRRRGVVDGERWPPVRRACYSATKAAEAPAGAELGSRVRPPRRTRQHGGAGATRTPINAGDEEVVTRMTASTPAGRPGHPRRGGGRHRLAGLRRGVYVHGALIPVDGGITATRPV